MNSEQLNQLKSKVICRDEQFDLLNAYLSNDSSVCVPTLLVQGYRSIGKTLTVDEYLKQLSGKVTRINCDQFITAKLLLQACLRNIRTDSGMDLSLSPEYYYRGVSTSKLEQTCDNFSNFQFNISQFLKDTDYQEHHFLVLDRLDQFIEDHLHLFNAFSRLHDAGDIKNITVIFITGMDTSHELVTSGIPHVYFDPYSESDIIRILQKNPFCFFGFPDEGSLGQQFWNSFVQVLVNLYYEYSASNLSVLIDLCYKKWPIFTDTIVKGSYSPSQFLQVYKENREIFLFEELLNSQVINYKTSKPVEESTALNLKDMTNLIKFVLVASYLASYIDPRNDMHFFSAIKYEKLREIKKFKKKDELTKKDMDNKLFQPNFFDLERLYAIVLVIYRNFSKSFEEEHELIDLMDDTDENDMINKQHEISKFSLVGNIDLQSQLSILLSRGLLARQESRDVLQPKPRWKCNTPWETIKVIAQDLQFPIEDYLG